MGNLLQTGQAALVEKLMGAAASRVIYRRGELAIECSAIVGKTSYQATTEDGFSVEATAVDYLIKKESLKSGGVVIEPEQGDRIETTFDTFEVLHLPDDGCWRYSDPYGTLYRIHTKKIEANNGE